MNTAAMLDRTGHSILVVDDHEATRYATSRTLQAAGYKTIEAATGAEALRFAESASAVVLDVHLPDLDGFEVCRRLRQQEGRQSLPVVHVSSVYITGYAQDRAQRAGADAYLVSPIDPNKLLAVLDELVRKR